MAREREEEAKRKAKEEAKRKAEAEAEKQGNVQPMKVVRSQFRRSLLCSVSETV
jgi:hypothetical protein